MHPCFIMSFHLSYSLALLFCNFCDFIDDVWNGWSHSLVSPSVLEVHASITSHYSIKKSTKYHASSFLWEPLIAFDARCEIQSLRTYSGNTAALEFTRLFPFLATVVVIFTLKQKEWYLCMNLDCTLLGCCSMIVVHLHAQL